MSAIAAQQAEKCLHVQTQARQHHTVRAGHARDSSPASREVPPRAGTGHPVRASHARDSSLANKEALPSAAPATAQL